MLNRRSAAITSSSDPSFRKSERWKGSTMWSSELARKTITAERRMGSHKETIGTIATSC